MLWVKIVNDGTGDMIEGNYNVQVGINEMIVYETRIEYFNRLIGWKGLLQVLSENLDNCKDELKKNAGEEKMKYKEFLEQDKYCRENNTPEGAGCDACPAKDKEHCADALRNLAGKFACTDYGSEEYHALLKTLEEDFDIPLFNLLELRKGILEFPE